jgi:hypothetical protein
MHLVRSAATRSCESLLFPAANMCYLLLLLLICRRGLAHMDLSMDNVLIDKPFLTEVCLQHNAMHAHTGLQPMHDVCALLCLALQHV